MAIYNTPLERTFIYVEHELYIKLLLVVKITMFDSSSTWQNVSLRCVVIINNLKMKLIVKWVQYFFLRFYPTTKIQKRKMNLRFWSIKKKKKNRRFVLLRFTEIYPISLYLYAHFLIVCIHRFPYVQISRRIFSSTLFSPCITVNSRLNLRKMFVFFPIKNMIWKWFVDTLAWRNLRDRSAGNTLWHRRN
jgi:hypothetical protein